MVRHINKEIFLNAITCPTLGWSARHEKLPESEVSLHDEFMMEQGKIIGEKARELFRPMEITWF